MSGHSSPEQARVITSLEAGISRSSSPINDLLDLALLYLEPAHREDEAIALLDGLLARDPGNVEARLWLAYALIHFRMDATALARAEALLTPLINETPSGAAASMLLAEVRDEQGADLTGRIELLEHSISFATNWVSNRQDLAWAYSEAGRQTDARDQLQLALQAVIAADPSWDHRRSSFEESITGRTAAGSSERLRADLQALA